MFYESHPNARVFVIAVGFQTTDQSFGDMYEKHEIICVSEAEYLDQRALMLFNGFDSRQDVAIAMTPSGRTYEYEVMESILFAALGSRPMFAYDVLACPPDEAFYRRHLVERMFVKTLTDAWFPRPTLSEPEARVVFRQSNKAMKLERYDAEHDSAQLKIAWNVVKPERAEFTRPLFKMVVTYSLDGVVVQQHSFGQTWHPLQKEKGDSCTSDIETTLPNEESFDVCGMTLSSDPKRLLTLTDNQRHEDYTFIGSNEKFPDAYDEVKVVCFSDCALSAKDSSNLVATTTADKKKNKKSELM